MHKLVKLSKKGKNPQLKFILRIFLFCFFYSNNAKCQNNPINEFELILNRVYAKGLDDSTRKMYSNFLKDYNNTMLSDSIQRIFSKRDFLEKGKKIPDFLLRDINGKLVSLSSLEGSVVYISFWASWCSPCIEGIKKMNELKNKHPYLNGVKFLYISVEKDVGLWMKLVKSLEIKGINLIDIYPDRIAVKKLQIPYLPYYFIVDKNGCFAEINPPRPIVNNGDDLVSILQKILSK